jgi:NitT/TauT family transport system substrate-binding protein
MNLTRYRMRTLHVILSFIVIFSLAIWAGALAGCSTARTTQPTTVAPEHTTVRIAALKGPTGISLVKIMADQEAAVTKNDYQVSLFGSSDDIVAQISSKQIDIAALPTNLGAVLYQRTNKQIKLLAINTLGVLYILENGNSVHSLPDLADREIITSGQGAVPEYVLNDLLAHGGLAKPARVEYKSEHAEVMTLAAAGRSDLVMLPEPFVTTLLGKNDQFRIALDLTAEWKKIHQREGSSSELSMGCLVVTADFAKDHPAVLNQFLVEYKASTDYVNNNQTEAGTLVAKFSIMADAALAAKAIPNCHIVLIQGSGMQPVLEPFLEILLASKPASIGGKLPDPEFYWIP